eukprot:PhM_4_TR9477/c1_g2_i1/m.2124
MTIRNNNHNSRIEHYRTMYRFSFFHRTATRAVMLLRIGKHLASRQHRVPENDYELCDLMTEHVLSFCVDTRQVLVVDITSRDADYSHAIARTCLVFDDNPDSNDVARARWSETSPPVHFIFKPMRFRRAVDWVWEWDRSFITRYCNEAIDNGISLDMHHTDSLLHSNDINKLKRFGEHVFLELALPSGINVSRICDEFLRECSRLRYLDLSSVTKVSEIGDRFLEGCSALKSLDLSLLTNVSEIGDFFLSDCRSLTSLDVSPLANVKVVGGFLEGCSALKSLDLSPLTNVSELGDRFLHDCRLLTSLDLPPLGNVSKIGNSFLRNCSTLTSLDLSPLTNISGIGWNFLCNCSALTALDLSPLANVRKIGLQFLCDCSSLTALDLSPLANVSKIGRGFLRGSRSLTSVDL